MESFTELMRQGTAHAWLFIPSAILLGALHGLEPGHSKTMMAAFIVAIRGTAWQAVLLGLSATASHTAVVWAVALAGLYFGSQWDPQTSEPYFQIASAVAIVGVALWMIVRTWRAQQSAAHAGTHHNDHDHGHDTAIHMVRIMPITMQALMSPRRAIRTLTSANMPRPFGTASPTGMSRRDRSWCSA